MNNDECLFHWLVAMLRGRTVQQFTRRIDQLKRSRSRCAEIEGDAWTDGSGLYTGCLTVPHEIVTEA